MNETYEGSCHCGAIGYEFATGRPPSEWSVRACQCSFCRGHGSVCTSDPAGSVRFFRRSQDALNRYRFGLETADFLLCNRCGTYIGALIESDNGRFGIVCVNTLRRTPAGLPAPQAMDYDGEDTAGRVLRREERWTPVLGEF